MDVGAIWDHITDIDPDAEAYGSIRGLVALSSFGHLLLHLQGAAHCSVDAVEHNESGIAPCVDDPACAYRLCYPNVLTTKTAEP